MLQTVQDKQSIRKEGWKKMKKISSILLILWIICIPVTAYAGHAPLKLTPQSAAYITDETEVSLISYMAYLKVRGNFSFINTEMVIKNQSTSKIDIIMGIPAYFDSASRVDSLTVTIHNKKVNFWSPNGTSNPNNPDSADSPDKWHVWKVTMEPNETKVVQCEFTISNGLYNNGTKKVLFPLRFLKSWNGPINHIQIVMDLDFHPPYVFDPNPSVAPAQYEKSGHLTWKFYDVEDPQDIIMYFRPIDEIVLKFLGSLQNSEIDNITNFYTNNYLDQTITAIDEFLAANPQFSHRAELDFLQALTCQKAFDINKAFQIMDRLELNWKDRPCFGDVSNTIRNKIIYDKTSILEATHGSEKALEYLQNIRPDIQGSELFVKWADDEIKRLTPAPPPQEEENPDTQGDTEGETNPDDPQNQDTPLMESVDIFGYSIPVEYVVLAVLALIVILYLLSKRKSRRRRRDRLFR